VTDVTVQEPGFTVDVSVPSIGTVTSVSETVPSTTVPVTSTTFSVEVEERPKPTILVGDDIPTTYVKSLSVGSGPLSVSIDSSNDVTITHLGPESTGLTYQVYPTSILVDSTGHVRAVVGESTAASYRTSLGLTSIATENPSNVLTNSNTTSLGRSIANSSDSAAARTALSLGTASTYDFGDFAAAAHNHSADNITSGRLALDRLPELETFIPFKESFVLLDGGAANTSSFTPISDMFPDGARFDGRTP
tara:strand:+ start:66 stop:812 length:747 start_codon:yes stop_codon:yes gene_type:complete